jgi:V8-like Glu-specific endopeptidase
MPPSEHDHDLVVSAQTQYPGPLERSQAKLKRGKGDSTGTGGYRPGRPSAVALEVPANYVRPDKRYILVEESDKRFRLVGTTAAKISRVKLRFKLKPQAGVDNRVRITNTTAWPYSVHGHVIITYPDKKQYIGSGTMVNKHHVLTAGHVVYSKANGGWATSVQFNAAQNDGTVPFGSAFATYLFSFKGWTDSQLRDYDTGMLILDRDLGKRTGWMGLITTSDGNLSNHQITVAGYPGDKGGQQLWAATAPIVSVQGHQIGYNAYTKGGDSGSGVYGLWTGINLEHVCADHVAGPNGIPNTGSRLARDKFDRIINEWFPK